MKKRGPVGRGHVAEKGCTDILSKPAQDTRTTACVWMDAHLWLHTWLYTHTIFPFRKMNKMNQPFKRLKAY